jgi:hypothetical protein
MNYIFPFVKNMIIYSFPVAFCYGAYTGYNEINKAYILYGDNNFLSKLLYKCSKNQIYLLGSLTFGVSYMLYPITIPIGYIFLSILKKHSDNQNREFEENEQQIRYNYQQQILEQNPLLQELIQQQDEGLG